MTPKTAPNPVDFPLHPLRRFVTQPPDDYRERTFRIGTWKQLDGQWHSWQRLMYVGSCRRHEGAATIWINGNGRDHEVRWRVTSQLTGKLIAGPHNFGESDIAAHLAACGGYALPAFSGHSRFYISRGIQGATAADVLWLMAYCDRKIVEVYGGVW